MNVAFVVPHGAAEGRLRLAVPLGPLLVASALHDLAPEAECVLVAPDPNKSPARLARELAARGLDVVGVSADAASMPAGLDFVRALARAAPDTPVVIGGPSARTHGAEWLAASPNVVAVDGSDDEDVSAAVLDAAARRAPIPDHAAVLAPGDRGEAPRVRAADDRGDPDWSLASAGPFRAIETVPLGVAPTWPLRAARAGSRRSVARVVEEIEALAARPDGLAALLCDDPLDDADGYDEQLLERLASLDRPKPMLALRLRRLAGRPRSFFRLAARAGVSALLVRIDALEVGAVRSTREALRRASAEGIAGFGVVEHDGTARAMDALEGCLRAACALPLRRTRLVEVPPPPDAELASAEACEEALALARDALWVRDDANVGPSLRALAASGVESLAPRARSAAKPRLAQSLERFVRGRESAAPPPGRAPSVLWMAPLFDPSGTAEDARNLIFAATDGGVNVRAVEMRRLPIDVGLDDATDRRLRALAQTPVDATSVALIHGLPAYFRRVEGLARTIGRTQFDTDRIPESWAARCGELDEVWVPSTFNVDTFARAGVPVSKIFVLPTALDAARYEEDVPPLAELAGPRFRFGAVLEWNLRAGWDLLVEAFCREFRANEPVELVLRASSRAGKLPGEMRREVGAVIRKRLFLDASLCPPIRFLTDLLTPDEMRRLYRSVDAYVLPTRGDGFNRTLLEAMASGCPVIATRWSGHLDFANDTNAYLIDGALEPVPERALHDMPLFRGHRWTSPSVDHLRQHLRRVFEDRAGAKEKAQRGRAEVLAQYSRAKAAERLRSLLAREERARLAPRVDDRARDAAYDLRSSPSTPLDRPVRVTWEGPFFVHSGFAGTNREHAARLARDPAFEIACAPSEPDRFAPGDEPTIGALVRDRYHAPLSGAVDVHVSHRSPPRMAPPDEGRWIWYQPWSLGSLPIDWAAVCRSAADEVWCPSNASRQVYLDAGVPAERVVVVPGGVNVDRFRPDMPPRALATTRTFKILFAGEPSWRKGFDLVLAAYAETFSSRDDVVLVVKTSGHDAAAREATALAIQSHRSKPGAPEILHLAESLSERELASLYVACDVLVSPFRAEGFPLPVLEAMACGVPAIVTAGGSADDLCDATTSYFVPSRRRPLPDASVQTVAPPWVLEPDARVLGMRLREAMQDKTGRRERATASRERAVARFSWDRVHEIVAERLRDVAARATSQREPAAQVGQALVLRLDGCPMRGRRIARAIALGAASRPAQAIVDAANGASEAWTAALSEGAPVESEWLDELLASVESGGVDALLARADGGVALIARPAALAALAPDDGFQTGAALLDLARLLRESGARVEEIPAMRAFSPSDPFAFRDECAAIDALRRALAALASNDPERALADVTTALLASPGNATAVKLASSLATRIAELRDDPVRA